MVHERETTRTADLSLRLLGGVALRLGDGRRRENRGKERKRQRVEHGKGTAKLLFVGNRRGSSKAGRRDREWDSVASDGMVGAEGEGRAHKAWGMRVALKHGTMSLTLGAHINRSMTWTHLF